MRRYSTLVAIILAASVSTAAVGADSYRVVDHLQIVKTGDQRVNPVQPVTLTDDLKRDDIAAVQKCKDLGPASNNPEAEADVINRCLADNTILNLKVVPTTVMVKAVLQ
jgi:hypothetical protein